MFTTRPDILGSFGVVASTHWLASAVGMAMLEKGGNAFDAAVAMGLTLQVVEPHMNGPAGDVPAIIYDASEEKVSVYCGQGPAPAGATIAHYRGLGLDRVPGTGLLAAVIPGAFDAWMAMLHDRGRLPLATVMEPAIGYARDGYPAIPAICETLADVAALFREEWTSSAAIYLGAGVPTAGARLRNPALAETYGRILRTAEAAGGDREHRIAAARRAWSEGFVAEAIGRFCAESEIMDSSGARHRGVLTAADMAGWRARVEDPLSYDYHGHTVFKAGPWSQAPVFLQQLALLKGFDLATMDPTGPDFVHTVIECAKLAFADREAFYGDPDMVDVPIDHLLSDAYNDTRRGLVGADASLDLRPGTVPGYERTIPAHEVGEPTVPGGGLGLGEPLLAESGERPGDTCHIDVIDKDGNMVAAMPSGGWLQSSPIIPALGFPLGSRAQMFWLEEGLPGSLAPGKRPRTTLTPSLAFRDGAPYMAFGSPGGDGQDQWGVVFFLRHVHHGMTLQQAIEAPAFLSEHWPNSFYPRRSLPGRLTLEGRFSAATIAELRRRSHDVAVSGDWSLGRLSAASRDGDWLRAGANPRGMQGYAIGR